MHAQRAPALLFTLLALSSTSCAPEGATRGPPRGVRAYAPDVEARVERVTRGLLPETALENRFGPAATLKERMAHWRAPGVSVAVINDGKLEWARGFGVREAGAPGEVTTETLFQAASISKAVFALGAMRLAAAGKVDLDEDVNRYLVSWKVPPNGEWQPRVTLRQIFSHSAGLTAHGFPGYHPAEARPTLAQILLGLPPSNTDEVRVNVLPGTMFRYSGGGTIVAQLALTELLRRPFDELMADAVLRPFGMAHSTYAQPLPAALRESASAAHSVDGTAISGKWHVYPEAAAGGLWTTPSDLATLGLEVQRALEGRSTMLSRELAEQMLTPVVPIDSGGDENLGIGFWLKGKGASARFFHTGDNEGFSALATFYRGLGKGAVIMVNSDRWGRALIDELERAIAREYGWPDYFVEEKPPKAAPASALEAAAGEYQTEAGVRFAVELSQGRLRLSVGKQPPVELTPRDESTFSLADLNAQVEFRKGAARPDDRLILRQEGKSFEARRR